MANIPGMMKNWIPGIYHPGAFVSLLMPDGSVTNVQCSDSTCDKCRHERSNALSEIEPYRCELFNVALKVIPDKNAAHKHSEQRCEQCLEAQEHLRQYKKLVE